MARQAHTTPVSQTPPRQQVRRRLTGCRSARPLSRCSATSSHRHRCRHRCHVTPSPRGGGAEAQQRSASLSSTAAADLVTRRAASDSRLVCIAVAARGSSHQPHLNSPRNSIGNSCAAQPAAAVRTPSHHQTPHPPHPHPPCSSDHSGSSDSLSSAAQTGPASSSGHHLLPAPVRSAAWIVDDVADVGSEPCNSDKDLLLLLYSAPNALLHIAPVLSLRPDSSDQLSPPCCSQQPHSASATHNRRRSARAVLPIGDSVDALRPSPRTHSDGLTAPRSAAPGSADHLALRPAVTAPRSADFVAPRLVVTALGCSAELDVPRPVVEAPWSAKLDVPRTVVAALRSADLCALRPVVAAPPSSSHNTRRSAECNALWSANLVAFRSTEAAPRLAGFDASQPPDRYARRQQRRQPPRDAECWLMPSQESGGARAPIVPPAERPAGSEYPPCPVLPAVPVASGVRRVLPTAAAAGSPVLPTAALRSMRRPAPCDGGSPPSPRPASTWPAGDDRGGTRVTSPCPLGPVRSPRRHALQSGSPAATSSPQVSLPNAIVLAPRPAAGSSVRPVNLSRPWVPSLGAAPADPLSASRRPKASSPQAMLSAPLPAAVEWRRSASDRERLEGTGHANNRQASEVAVTATGVAAEWRRSASDRERRDAAYDNTCSNPRAGRTGDAAGVAAARLLRRCRTSVRAERSAGPAQPPYDGAASSVAGSSEDTAACLNRVLQLLMLGDADMYRRVQHSCAGITSLAKETTALQYSRDPTTGATCINQYVILKTLGRGSVGKVKLCLNTLDGQIYAIKMVDRGALRIQAQQQSLRRRFPSLRRAPAAAAIVGDPVLPAAAAAAVAVAAAAPDPLHHHQHSAADAFRIPSCSSANSTLSADTSRRSAPLHHHDERNSGSSSSSVFAVAARNSTHGSTRSHQHSAPQCEGKPGHGDGACSPRVERSAFSTPNSSRRFGSLTVIKEGDQAAEAGSASGDATASGTLGIMREVAVLKQVVHPAVVKLHEVIDSPASPSLMLVLEYCEGGPVITTPGQSGFDRLSEPRARELMTQLCDGLDYLHRNGIVHGDLKPENLLLSAGGQLKIADFGSARMVSMDIQSPWESLGTPAFQAPEQLIGTHLMACGASPFAGDVWAVGCILYCFLYGRLPFQGTCAITVRRAILTGEVAYANDGAQAAVSSAAIDLLRCIFVKDPAQRITLQGVIDHPWMRHQTDDAAPMMSPRLPPFSGSPDVIQGSFTQQPPAAAGDDAPLVALLRAQLQERTVRRGDFLYREGEEAVGVYMILSGVVELITDLALGADAAARAQQQLPQLAAAAVQPPKGLDATAAGAADWLSPEASATEVEPWRNEEEEEGAGTEEEEYSLVVEMDESLNMDTGRDHMGAAGRAALAAAAARDGQLRIDADQARALKQRILRSALMVCPEYVLEVKGPGQVLGLLALEEGAGCELRTHTHSARARGDAVVVGLTQEALIRAVMQRYGGGPGADHGTVSTASVQAAMRRYDGGPDALGGTASVQAGGGSVSDQASGTASSQTGDTTCAQAGGTASVPQAAVKQHGGGTINKVLMTSPPPPPRRALSKALSSREASAVRQGLEELEVSVSHHSFSGRPLGGSASAARRYR